MVSAAQTLDPRWEASASAPVSGRSIAPIHLSIHDRLDEVEGLWRDFETSADATPFQSFGWLSTWFNAIGRSKGVKPVIVVGHDGDGRVLCLFPLAIDRLGPARQLTWLGSHLCDYNAPLLALEFSTLVPAAAFVALWERIKLLLRDRGIAYDVIRFEKMPERCGSQPNPLLQLPVGLHPCSAHATRLAADWTSFYAAKRSSATRRKDRKKRIRMSQNGELRFVTASGRADIQRTLHTLVEQKARSLAEVGAANMFAPPGHTEFYIGLATDRRNRDLVHVSRLEIGSAVCAVNLGLVFRGTYYHVLASYGGGEVARYGPGVEHLHELMKYAIGRGLDVFDFTIGNEAYKRLWCDLELRLYDHVAACSLRGWFVVPALLAARWAKRAMKKSPLIWRAFSRGREMLAAWRRSPAAP